MVPRAGALILCALALLSTASSALGHHADGNTTIYIPDSTTYLLSKSLAGTMPNGPFSGDAVTEP